MSFGKIPGRRKAGRDGRGRRKTEAFLAQGQTFIGLSVSGACAAAEQAVKAALGAVSS